MSNNGEEIFESDSEASYDSYYQTEDNDFVDSIQTITPAVYLPEIVIQTDEEKFDLLYKCRSKVFRWRDDKWKERGIGVLKILRDKINYRIRIVLRQDQTKKAMINFFIEEEPLCEIKSYLESERMFFLMARDFSDGTGAEVERFVFKFTDSSGKILFNLVAEEFREKFNQSKEFLEKLEHGESADLVFQEIFDKE
jgi:hypothetical protein